MFSKQGLDPTKPFVLDVEGLCSNFAPRIFQVMTWITWTHAHRRGDQVPLLEFLQATFVDAD